MFDHVIAGTELRFSLEKLNLTHFNTNNVTDMSYIGISGNLYIIDKFFNKIYNSNNNLSNIDIQTWVMTSILLFEKWASIHSE